MRDACELLLQGKDRQARELVAEAYPLDAAPKPDFNYNGLRIQEPLVTPRPKRPPSPSPRRLVELHRRDGYVDRYSGARLIAPAVLRLLGDQDHGPLRRVLPYHVNGGRGKPAASGARSVCHQAGFELYASWEHVRPVRVGGEDDFTNLVTCSPDVNLEKGTETWEPCHLHTDLKEWDGLSTWFVEYTNEAAHGWLPNLAQWRRAFLASSS